MWGMRVRAEPIRGEAPPHGLVATAFEGQVSEAEWSALSGIGEGEAATAWMRGIKWRPTSCVEATAWDPNCANWPKADKPDYPDPQAIYEVDPFVITTTYGCKLVANGGNEVVDEARAVALEQLELATPKALEFQFWTNTLGSRMQSLDSSATEITGLTSAAVTITGSGGFDRQVGLALAGQALANCGAGIRGMIHAPSWIVQLWIADGHLVEEDGILYTADRRDRVVSGSGYTGEGPEGVDPVTGTFSWIFATGPVEVYLGPPELISEEISESMDRTTNDFQFTAERVVLTRWDTCCHTAVLIDGAANGGG